MSGYTVTLISGKTYTATAEGGSKIQQSLLANGTAPQAFEVELDGKSCFLNSAAVALVEITEDADAIMMIEPIIADVDADDVDAVVNEAVP